MTEFLIIIGFLAIIFIVAKLLKHIPLIGLDTQTLEDASAEYVPLSKDDEHYQKIFEYFYIIVLY